MKAPGRFLQLALGAILAFAAIMAAGSVAPVQAAADVTFDGSCLPTSIRPGEDALVTCTSTFTNNGDETAFNVTQEATIADGLAIPFFSIYNQTVDGEPVFVGSGDLVGEFGDLAPGQTLEVVTEIIFNVGVGPHGGLINITASGEFVTSSLLQIDGDPESPYPPTDLTITKTRISAPPAFAPPPGPISPPGGVTDPGPISAAAQEVRPLPTPAPLSHGGPISPPIEPDPGLGPVEFEIVVRNESDVLMAGVTLRDKHPQGVGLAFAEPAATEVNETTNIARWDLGPLGPGEEARVLLELTSGGGCFSLENAAVATALGPDGEEHYVAFPDVSVIGICGGGGNGGQGGDGLANAEAGASPLALPSTGSDTSSVGVGWVWQVAAAALTAAAALAFVAYRLVRPRP